MHLLACTCVSALPDVLSPLLFPPLHLMLYPTARKNTKRSRVISPTILCIAWLLFLHFCHLSFIYIIKHIYCCHERSTWCFLQVSLLRMHYYSQFLVGILPCAIGMGGQLPELFDYLSDMEHSQTPTFKGTFPMVIIWYIFFLVALQIHGFAMYFSYHLTASWQPLKKRD